jgi:hypothetical protein
VTLGIPRLREILLTAAARIKTPTLTIPLRAGCGGREAALLANRMRKLRLAECLKVGAAAPGGAGRGRGGGTRAPAVLARAARRRSAACARAPKRSKAARPALPFSRQAERLPRRPAAAPKP